jgi:hypothetical protein
MRNEYPVVGHDRHLIDDRAFGSDLKGAIAGLGATKTAVSLGQWLAVDGRGSAHAAS